jgi:hypothetical protein
MEEIISLGILNVKVDGGLVQKISALEGVNPETKCFMNFLVLLQKYAPYYGQERRSSLDL